MNSSLKKTIKVAGAALALGVTGCSVQPKLTLIPDAFSDHTGFKYEYIDTLDCETMSDTSYNESIAYVGVPGITTLRLIYTGEGWRFLDPDLGLDLLIDGEKHHMFGVNKKRITTGGKSVAEAVDYKLTSEMADKLSKAQKVRVRALGSHGKYERCLGPEQLTLINEIKQYI